MPALPLQALRQRIASRDLAPVHLLLGDDVRLVERLIEAMEATIEPADRPFAVDRLHAGEPGATPWAKPLSMTTLRVYGSVAS